MNNILTAWEIQTVLPNSPANWRIEKNEIWAVLVHFLPILGELANSKGELGNTEYTYSNNIKKVFPESGPTQDKKSKSMSKLFVEAHANTNFP